MTTPILLDAGPSRCGWHRLEAVLRCPQLYAGKRQGYLDGQREPLVRGSIGHVGLAQLYARLRESQRGGDPERYMRPNEAMTRAAMEFGELGTSMLQVAAPLVKAYADHYGFERLRVLDVEREHETRFHGHLYTARIDLEVEDAAGKVWFYDHKIVSKLETKTFSRYALSGQFLGQTYLGRQAYGDRFAGIRLNILAVGNRFERAVIDPAPWMLERFPEVVKQANEMIATIDMATKVAEERDQPLPFFGATTTEVSCMTPYGPCDAFELCRWGPAE